MTLLLAMALACRNDEPAAEKDDGCTTDREFMEESFWPVYTGDCSGCHSSGGAADGTRFVLDPGPGSPTKKEFETVWELAGELEPNIGRPVMQLKPLGLLNHSGGMRFMEGSEEAGIMEELVRRAAEPGGCEDPAPSCSDAEAQATERGLRRMTAVQLRNTVGDLFGEELETDGLYPETYAQEAEGRHVAIYSAEELSQLQDSAESVSAQLGDPSGCTDSSCVGDWLAERAETAWRRPLETDERDAFEAFSTLAGDPSEGVQAGLEAILLSPQFLYRGSIQDPAHSLAEKLSYFLWDAPPDAELRAAASDGAILDSAELEEQALRMMEDPRAAEAFARAVREWLGFARVLGSLKDPSEHPGFDTDLAASMVRESELFAEKVWTDEPTLSALFTSANAVVNSDMEELYGADAGSADSGDWTETELDPAQRSGILSRAAFNASHASLMHTSVPHRGHMTLRRVLCMEFGIAPLGFDMDGFSVATEPGETPQDQAEAHRYDPICVNCHTLLDPAGLALESYDAVGAWRESYLDGDPVDTSGEMPLIGLAFSGAAEMQSGFLEEERLYECVARRSLERANGPAMDGGEECAAEGLGGGFMASGGNLRELMLSVVLHPSFQEEP